MANKRLITHDGITDTLTGWSRRTGVPPTTIKARLDQLEGWSLHDALWTPPNRDFARGGRRPASAPRPCPPLKEHPGGQAYCRWSEGGRDQWRYFGKWGTDDAAKAYRRFAAEWAAGGPPAATGGAAFVGEVVTAWVEHCRQTYRKRDKPTSEYHCNRSATAPLADLYGDTPAAEFDPAKFRTVRAAMCERWASRKTVNDHAARVVRMFGWAATMGLVPLTVHQLLQRVEPIAAGRTGLAEPKKKKPVPADHIDKIMPHLHPNPKRRAVLAAMVRVQQLTGMRPGELVTFRPEDVDRTREPWRYDATAESKMLHRDVERVIYFGPRARAALAPFLDAAEPGKPVFRFPPWWSKVGWSPISVVRYRNRIRLACKAAGVPVWTPHRLRHNKATDVMERYEDDAAAGAAIGDSPEVARRVYADRAGDAVARRIAEATG